MRLNFVPISVFRETPQVSFFDTGVQGSNGADIVIHHKNAISPPDDDTFEQYYIHQHQIDHNLVIEGSRTFTLLNPKWDEPHHVIFLSCDGCFLNCNWNLPPIRICKEGSMLLNQATRNEMFDPKKEF